MINHPIALATLLSVASFTPTDAFVEIFPRGTTTSSRGGFSETNSFEKQSNGILKKMRSAVAECSPVTSRLFMLEESEAYYHEGVILDATQTNDQWSNVNDEWMGSSLFMGQSDTLQDSNASPVEAKTSEIAPNTATGTTTTMTSGSSTAASASPPPPSTATATATQSIGGGSLSALTTASGFSAAASIGTATLGGLAVARNVLAQRQKKLDEEQRNLEEQQKRLESEAQKLQKDTSQNNFLLSTIGSVAVGTALSTGGFVEEITESTVRSVEGMTDVLTLENSIKENLKGEGFKTTAGTVVERPGLNQEELPYLEKEIQQAATKQQVEQKTTNVLTNKKEKLLLKQDELEYMASKREAAIAKEEKRLKAIADEEERLRIQEERRLLAEKNEAARLKREAEEAEAARAKAAEDGRLRQIAEEARMKKEVEEARIQKEAEEARIKEARIQKETEEARIQKEVEEARIQKEKDEEVERLLKLENESIEQAKQDSMAREQRALEILREQQEGPALQEQRSTSSSPIFAGANVLRDYANRFSDSFIPFQSPSRIDTDKLQLLIKQLGLSPGLAVGITATLVFGGSVTAMKRMLDEADENSDNSGLKQKGSESNTSQEDNLSSQVANLLEKKRKEDAEVRKTIRIPTPTPSPPPPKKVYFSSGSLSKKAPPSPDGLPNLNVFQPKNASISNEKTLGSPKFFGSSSQESAGLPDEGGVSPFGTVSKKAVSRKQTASPFGTSTQNDGSFSGFGSPPPKLSKSQNNMKNSPFGTAPKQSGLKKQSISPFGTSVPKMIKRTGKKEGFTYGASGKQGAFGISKKEPASRPDYNGDFERSASKSAESQNRFKSRTEKLGGLSSEKVGSPFGTFSKQVPSGNKTTSQFRTSSPPPKSTDSPNNSPNIVGFSQKKSIAFSGEKNDSPFGAPPKQNVAGKQLASPFATSTKKTRSLNTFGSPPPTVVGQSSKKIASPSIAYSKPNVPKKEVVSPFRDNSSKSSRSFGIPPKEATLGKDSKKPFNPFSKRNQFLNNSKRSFSSDGPVYMPPTLKTKNAESLNDVYSSLDRNKSNNGDGIKEKSQLERVDTFSTSGPKKSFSPFGGVKRVTKPTLVDSSTNSIPSAPSTILDTTTDMTNPSTSSGTEVGSSEEGKKKTDLSKQVVSAQSSGSASLGSAYTPTPPSVKVQGIKKSYSPFGRKPKQGTNLPKVDPSSFSFGAPPSKPSLQQNSASLKNTTSFSFRPDMTSSAVKKSSPSFNNPVFQGSPGDKASTSNNRQSNNMVSVSQPFAATGFPPRGKNINGRQNDDGSGIKRDRLKNLDNSRMKAMEEIRDGQEEE